MLATCKSFKKVFTLTPIEVLYKSGYAINKTKNIKKKPRKKMQILFIGNEKNIDIRVTRQRNSTTGIWSFNKKYKGAYKNAVHENNRTAELMFKLKYKNKKYRAQKHKKICFGR